MPQQTRKNRKEMKDGKLPEGNDETLSGKMVYGKK